MVERLLSSPLSLLGALIASILCVKHNSDSSYHFSSTSRQGFKRRSIFSTTAVSSEAWAKLREWAILAGKGRLLLSGSVVLASLKAAVKGGC